ncbi:MAG: hypothetical protein H6Q65_271 [Firmicutes bacterium]|nr:hypothetical protein [Bacillota bacterium]
MFQGQKGFILAEALVASVIVSVALAAIAGMFICSLQANAIAADYTTAANLAQEKMELLAAMDPAVLFSTTFNDEEISLNNILFFRRTVIQVRSDLDAGNRLIQATVQVSWHTAGKPFHVSLQNYFVRTNFSQYP